MISLKRYFKINRLEPISLASLSTIFPFSLRKYKIFNYFVQNKMETDLCNSCCFALVVQLKNRSNLQRSGVDKHLSPMRKI